MLHITHITLLATKARNSRGSNAEPLDCVVGVARAAGAARVAVPVAVAEGAARPWTPPLLEVLGWLPPSR
jgi:hypothetical protein